MDETNNRTPEPFITGNELKVGDTVRFDGEGDLLTVADILPRGWRDGWPQPQVIFFQETTWKWFCSDNELPRWERIERR